MNPNKSKLQPEKTGPYVIIQVNKDTNTYTLEDYKGKQRKLHLDTLRPCVACEKQRKAKEIIPSELLEKYQARSKNLLPS